MMTQTETLEEITVGWMCEDCGELYDDKRPGRCEKCNSDAIDTLTAKFPKEWGKTKAKQLYYRLQGMREGNE